MLSLIIGYVHKYSFVFPFKSYFGRKFPCIFSLGAFFFLRKVSKDFILGGKLRRRKEVWAMKSERNCDHPEVG